MLYRLIILGSCLVFAMMPLFLPMPAQAATTYDLATTSNWNVRFDGAAAGDNLTLDQQ